MPIFLIPPEYLSPGPRDAIRHSAKPLVARTAKGLHVVIDITLDP